MILTRLQNQAVRRSDYGKKATGDRAPQAGSIQGGNKGKVPLLSHRSV